MKKVTVVLSIGLILASLLVSITYNSSSSMTAYDTPGPMIIKDVAFEACPGPMSEKNVANNEGPGTLIQQT